MYIFPEIEAEALVYAAQLSLKQGVKIYGHQAMKAIVTIILLLLPLGPPQFLYLRDYLLGYKIPEKGCVMGNSK